MNITKSDESAIHHMGLNIKTPIAMGTESTKAVNIASCCGDKFFFENIIFLFFDGQALMHTGCENRQ